MDKCVHTYVNCVTLFRLQTFRGGIVQTVKSVSLAQQTVTGHTIILELNFNKWHNVHDEKNAQPLLLSS